MHIIASQWGYLQSHVQRGIHFHWIAVMLGWNSDRYSQVYLACALWAYRAYERRPRCMPLQLGKWVCMHADMQLWLHGFRLLYVLFGYSARHGHLQCEPMHGHDAYKRRHGHVHVECRERNLVRTHMQHAGVRPDRKRGVRLFSRSPIRHSDVHGYTEVRTLQQTDPLARRARGRAERLHALER